MDETNGLWRPKDLSKEEFDLLLKTLHPDRDVAGGEYLLLIERLRLYFGTLGRLDPDELAAETLQRVAKKLAAGENIKVLPAYCYGVARLIRLEALRKPDAQLSSLDEATQPRPLNPEDLEQKERILLLNRCLQTLPEQDARLFIEYWMDDQAGSKIDSRKRLAEEMNLTPTALRLRIFRIRAKLQDCLQKSLKK
jgi:RNA polymerase sigma factor (sigma-70 family)